MKKTKSINNTVFIERYLDGELQGEELERFIYKMTTDRNFASEVKLHRDLNEFLKTLK